MTDSEGITCNICGKSFNSKKQLEQHNKNVHDALSNDQNTRPKAGKKSHMNSKKLIAVVGVVALLSIIGGVWLYHGAGSQAPSSLTVDGIQCNPSEQLLFHVHAHLDIIINGQYFLVPAQIGILNTCYYWLHTHDVSGVIHIESPVNRNFTLGQFFDIWSKKINNGQIKFNNSQIFNYVASPSQPLNVYVNGTKVPSGTNYRDIKLDPHDEITIIYGTPQLNIPSSYSFPPGL
jgi:hypothetical protein